MASTAVCYSSLKPDAISRTVTVLEEGKTMTTQAYNEIRDRTRVLSTECIWRVQINKDTSYRAIRVINSASDMRLIVLPDADATFFQQPIDPAELVNKIIAGTMTSFGKAAVPIRARITRAGLILASDAIDDDTLLTPSTTGNAAKLLFTLNVIEPESLAGPNCGFVFLRNADGSDGIFARIDHALEARFIRTNFRSGHPNQERLAGLVASRDATGLPRMSPAVENKFKPRRPGSAHFTSIGKWLAEYPGRTNLLTGLKRRFGSVPMVHWTSRRRLSEEHGLDPIEVWGLEEGLWLEVLIQNGIFGAENADEKIASIDMAPMAKKTKKTGSNKESASAQPAAAASAASASMN